MGSSLNSWRRKHHPVDRWALAACPVAPWCFSINPRPGCSQAEGTSEGLAGPELPQPGLSLERGHHRRASFLFIKLFFHVRRVEELLAENEDIKPR